MSEGGSGVLFGWVVEKVFVGVGESVGLEGEEERCGETLRVRWEKVKEFWLGEWGYEGE